MKPKLHDYSDIAKRIQDSLRKVHNTKNISISIVPDPSSGNLRIELDIIHGITIDCYTHYISLFLLESFDLGHQIHIIYTEVLGILSNTMYTPKASKEEMTLLLKSTSEHKSIYKSIW